MNNKRFAFLGFISLFFMSVLATAARADILKTIKNSFQGGGILSYIFYDFPNALQAGSAAGIIGARILIIFLVFSVFFGISQIALKNYARNIRIAITLIIALIAGIAIPGSLVQEIALLWGGLLYFLLVAGPVVGLTYLIFGVFKGEERWDYLVKFICAAILVYVTTSLAGGFGGVMAAGSTFWDSIWGGIDTIFTLLGFIYIVLSVYFLYKFISPEGGASNVGVPEGIKKLWKRKYGRDDFTKEPGILRDIQTAINKKESWNDAQKKFRKSSKILKRLNKLIMYTDKQVESIEDAAKKATMKRDLTRMEAAITSVTDNLDKIEKVWSGGRAPTAANWNAMKTQIGNVITGHNLLMKLETQFLKDIGAI